MAQKAKSSKRTPSRVTRKPAAKVVKQKAQTGLLDKTNRLFPLAIVVIFGILTALILLYNEWQKNSFESSLTDLVAESSGTYGESDDVLFTAADFGESNALICSQKEITTIDFETDNWEVDLGTLHRLDNVEYSVVEHNRSKQLLVSIDASKSGLFHTYLNMATKPGKYTLSYDIDYDKTVLTKNDKIKRIGISVQSKKDGSSWADFGTGLYFTKTYGVTTQFNVEEFANNVGTSGSYNMDYQQGNYPRKVNIDPPFTVQVVRRDDPNRNRGSLNKNGTPYYIGRRRISNTDLKTGDGRVFFYIVTDARPNATEKYQFYIDNIQLVSCK